MPKIKNLFIVDDSKMILTITEKIFKNCDFKTHTFSDPNLALTAVETISPRYYLTRLLYARNDWSGLHG